MEVSLTQPLQSALSTRSLSLRELACATGVSRTYLAQISAGLVSPSEEIRVRILEYFKKGDAGELLVPPSPTEPALTVIPCKNSQSARTIKHGLQNGIQRYHCKDCGSVFIHNLAPFHSHLPVEAVLVVLENFFEGQPLDSIRRLLEESQGLSVTVAGLEKIIYRFSQKAVRLAADFTPFVGPHWYLEGTFLGGSRPLVILDVLDLQTGFLISSDLLSDFAEKERQSVLQSALRLTGSTPDLLIVSPELQEVCGGPDQPLVSHQTRLKREHRVLIQKFRFLAVARTQMLSRRLAFDSLFNCRLVCAAWRVHHNFLSGFKPAALSQYTTWRDIIATPRESECLTSNV
jgi:transcriptional regulator with XRE-family HTH domain